MKSILKRVFIWLLSHDEWPYQKQKEFIDSLHEPQSDFQRVHYGELCCHYGKLKLFCLNLIGFFASLIVLIVLCFKSFHVEKKEHKDLVIINADNRQGQAYSYNGRLPEEFISKFDDVITLRFDSFPKYTDGLINGYSLKVWLGMVLRYPLSWFTNFRCLINIMAYNKIINQYSPKAIMNARAEGNFMTTIVTHLCEGYGAEYDCFMHGELMCSSTTAFVRTSRMLIWDEHYIEVLNWSRFKTISFELYKPAIYSFESRSGKEQEKSCDILYALCGNELDGVEPHLTEKVNCLKSFANAGYRCKIRPHPRWSDYSSIKQQIEGSGIFFEDPRSKAVAYSIDETEYVIGTFSTVLTEAYYLGAKVIIDDVSEPDLFSELEYRKYFLLNKPHKLLSKFIEEINKNNS